MTLNVNKFIEILNNPKTVFDNIKDEIEYKLPVLQFYMDLTTRLSFDNLISFKRIIINSPESKKNIKLMRKAFNYLLSIKKHLIAYISRLGI